MALRRGEERPMIGSAQVDMPRRVSCDVIAAAANPTGWILLPVRGIDH